MPNSIQKNVLDNPLDNANAPNLFWVILCMRVNSVFCLLLSLVVILFLIVPLYLPTAKVADVSTGRIFGLIFISLAALSMAFISELGVKGLKRRKFYGWYISSVFGILCIPSILFLLGIPITFVLFQENTRRWFGINSH